MNKKQIRFLLTTVIPIALIVAALSIYFDLRSSIYLPIIIFFATFFGIAIRKIK